MQELVGLFVFLVLSIVFAVCMIVAGLICAPKAPNEQKKSVYECGMKLFSDADVQYDVKFLMYAVLFLIFDVQVILLFPFAVTFGKLGLFSFVEAGIFVLIMMFALMYAVRKNVLRWK